MKEVDKTATTILQRNEGANTREHGKTLFKQKALLNVRKHALSLRVVNT